MFGTTLTLAAGSLFALSFAAPVRNRAAIANPVVARSAQIMFGGDGSVADGWPTQSQWMPFAQAW